MSHIGRSQKLHDTPSREARGREEAPSGGRAAAPDAYYQGYGLPSAPGAGRPSFTGYLSSGLATIQAQAKRGGGAGGAAPDAAAKAGGRPLPEATRQGMERSFSADFSDVRIHEGSQAASIGALAYAQGSDIHFAPGQYAPSTRGGQEILGHELAHVVQQREGRVPATRQAKGLAVNDDASLEREADEMGARAARGEPARSGHAPSQGAGGGAASIQCLRGEYHAFEGAQLVQVLKDGVAYHVRIDGEDVVVKNPNNGADGGKSEEFNAPLAGMLGLSAPGTRKVTGGEVIGLQNIIPAVSGAWLIMDLVRGATLSDISLGGNSAPLDAQQLVQLGESIGFQYLTHVLDRWRLPGIAGSRTNYDNTMLEDGNVSLIDSTSTTPSSVEGYAETVRGLLSDMGGLVEIAMEVYRQLKPLKMFEPEMTEHAVVPLLIEGIERFIRRAAAVEPGELEALAGVDAEKHDFVQAMLPTFRMLAAKLSKPKKSKKKEKCAIM